ncbi:MAG: hypothetical protein JXQ87_02220 [Bacteroidia bacterium]
MSKKATKLIVIAAAILLMFTLGFKMTLSSKFHQDAPDENTKHFNDLRIYNYEKGIDLNEELFPFVKVEFEASTAKLELLQCTRLVNFSRNKCAWFIYGPKDGRINGTLTLLHKIC